MFGLDLSFVFRLTKEQFLETFEYICGDRLEHR